MHVAGQIITKDVIIIPMFEKEATVVLDLSKDSTFNLSFKIDDEKDIENAFSNIVSINMIFKFNEDPNDIFECIALYVYDGLVE